MPAWIALIASVAAALIAACATVAVALINRKASHETVKAVDMTALKDAFDQHVALDAQNMEALGDSVQRLERHMDENWMRGLRSDVWNPALPLAERVNSGMMFTEHGGNGETAAKHRKNLAALERGVE